MTRHHWTESEIKTLRRLCPTHAGREIAGVLERTGNVTRHRLK